MKSLIKYFAAVLVLVSICAEFSSCTKIDDDRTPKYVVNIPISAAQWTISGVGAPAYGDCVLYIKDKKLPGKYTYTANVYTGYGGVMLLNGYDFTTQQLSVPIAYEMACPVENKRSVLIEYDSEKQDAYCPTCGSRFNVLSGGGTPTSGQALDKKYGLTRYNVYSNTSGGYTITN